MNKTFIQAYFEYRRRGCKPPIAARAAHTDYTTGFLKGKDTDPSVAKGFMADYLECRLLYGLTPAQAAEDAGYWN